MTIGHADRGGEALDAISSAVACIIAMNIHIAHAAEQQSEVASE
ncbi:hypothetical protein [Thiohalomonas denitrificans]|nr:hypothetical protein [Thiohalomonas denitrificans]